MSQERKGKTENFVEVLPINAMLLAYMNDEVI